MIRLMVIVMVVKHKMQKKNRANHPVPANPKIYIVELHFLMIVIDSMRLQEIADPHAVLLFPENQYAVV
jgi:hypothetical protein